MRATLLALVVAVGLSPSAFAAGTVQLSIHDGRVDLKATNASVSQILTEWARVGGTRVENADRLTPVPITLEFDHAPESQALEVLLRSAAGFIAVPRRSAPGRSQFERILILASSNPPPVTAASLPAPAPAPFGAAPPPPFAAPPPVAQPPQMRLLPAGARPILGPDGHPLADDQEGAPPQPAGAPSMPPGFSPPPVAPPVPAAAPPAAPAAAPGAAAGSAVPGMVVKPQPQRRPGGN